MPYPTIRAACMSAAVVIMLAATATATATAAADAAAVATTTASAAAGASYPHAQSDYPELGVRVETVAEGLRVPWSIDWLPDGTPIFTERGGTLSIIRDEAALPEPLLSLDVGGGEGGLLGVAVDPHFEENGYIYVYYTYEEFFSTYNKIVRYRYDTGGGTLDDGLVILNGIPGSRWHDGGRIQFGPDGMLYATTGDAVEPGLAQDLNSLAGKILRMDRDGSVPDDNPWGGDLPLYSIGHRNPQGMDWNGDGALFVTEHGPSGWMGIGHDEINMIVPGGNYGWPVVIGSSGDGGGDGGNNEPRTRYVDPVFHTGDTTWAPSGAEFYDSDAIPEWQGRYFVAALLGRSLQMIQFDSSTPPAVDSHIGLFQNEFGRLRDVQTGPDGYLYLLTSNRDGRGTPALEDDRILRIVPLYEPAVTAAVDGSGASADPRQPLQRQALRTFTYDGPHAADTGPLRAALRHPGYDVTPVAFELEQKSLSFGFERVAPPPPHASRATGHSLSLYIEKPLLSPPFQIVPEDEHGATAAHADAGHTIRYGHDHYIVTFHTELDRGRITVTGAHVIPEYEGAMIAMAAASAAAILGGMLARRSLLSAPSAPAARRTLPC